MSTVGSCVGTGVVRACTFVLHCSLRVEADDAACQPPAAPAAAPTKAASCCTSGTFASPGSFTNDVHGTPHRVVAAVYGMVASADVSQHSRSRLPALTYVPKWHVSGKISYFDLRVNAGQPRQ